MNKLIFYGLALDVNPLSNHSKLREFYEIDKEIEHWQKTKSHEELSHSFEYALMKARAKQILKQLNIIN